MKTKNYSPIVNFYRGTHTDNVGRKIESIILWSDEFLEIVHNYIQWLFPLNEGSAFNEAAPVLTEIDIIEFKVDPTLRQNLLSAFKRLLLFYGLTICEGSATTIAYANNFERQAKNWITECNHNFLRITRILKCLTLLGLKKEAAAFLTILEDIHRKHHRVIGNETLRYWRGAIK